MADTAKYSKLGRGEFHNIDAAVQAGILDGKDIVITSDTSELVYIKDDQTKQIIRGRVPLFDSESDAVAALNAAADTYAGQPIAIKDFNNKYQLHTVQDGEAGFIVEPVGGISGTNTGFVWQEF